MTRIRVHAVSVSLDGFAAGPDQSEDDPIGRGGQQLHEWLFQTPTLRRYLGFPGADELDLGLDDRMAAAGIEGVGATVMGRNMFGPERGPWSDDPWRGWWGDEPPFHHPVFVVTHHERPPLELEGTTFHFVTDGVDVAVDRAVEAAGDRDVRVGGGASIVRQLLRSGRIDEMHLAYTPVLLGEGERIFDGPVDYTCTDLVQGERAVHAHFRPST